MADKQEKIIEAPASSLYQYQVGDDVDVVLTESKGLRAVVLSYLVPLVLLLAAVLTLTMVGVGELVAGGVGLAVVGLYYFLLWVFRSRIRKEYVFSVRNK